MPTPERQLLFVLQGKVRYHTPADVNTNILYLLFALNASSFLAFALDKALAKLGSRRIPEKTLCAFIFTGVAGAIGAMLLLRHKTSKPTFLRMAIVPGVGGILLSAALIYAGINLMR